MKKSSLYLFNKTQAGNMGILQKLGRRKHNRQQIFNQFRFGQDKQLSSLVLTSTKYFQSALVWADGILLPSLRKYLGRYAEYNIFFNFLKILTFGVSI